MSEAAASGPPASGGAYAEPQAHLRFRHFKDRVARHSVGIGGVAVLGSLLLIFVYLLLEVAPLFAPAQAALKAEFRLPGDAGATLFLAAEEQSEIGMRVSTSGELTFFDLTTGQAREQSRLPIGERTIATVTSVGQDGDYLAAGLSDGSVLLFKHTYAVSYPGNKRQIDPGVEFPHGEAPLPFLDEAPRSLVVREEGDELVFVASDSQHRVRIRTAAIETSLLGGSTLQPGVDTIFTPSVRPDLVLVNPLVDWLYVIDTTRGRIAFHRLRGTEPPELINTEDVGARILHARFLSGGISLLTADASGRITQWFPARRAETTPEGDSIWFLARVREFASPESAAVTALGGEPRRRGFAVATQAGRIGLYHSTAQHQVLELEVGGTAITRLGFEPRAHTLLALDADNLLRVFSLDNEYPEISWTSLWRRVWYESYDEPRYLWQSSAATSDFEPKFSLSPLALGTIKGAFYAMIFAVPLAVLGAIFTANFMAPPLRQVVKPTVEIMQALPTVVLGFLAGLWLAPFVEANLPGVFLTLILLPLSIPVAGYGWGRLPARIRFLVPAGWEAVLLVPIVLGIVWLCFALAKPLELLFFAGNMQGWMDQTLGIGYDQRNCLVVGIAMGVAVIPGIFSIAEDAIFSVPKQLTLGSLALGATPWQTLIGVVLPTASPGIFSAVMIGLGRAVGETMIVLMATGNTAVMDFSAFSGMRTFSANVAVEMPESEVGSTHFRLLFLAGFVLFLFTFAINTLAEVIRQRLREKYGNL
jgi:phosphate transport system permease protein